MRSLLLDIELTPNNRPPSSTTVIRMHIQPGDALRRSQHDGQLQLCVPQVTLKGAPYPALPSAGSRADHPDLRQAQAMPSRFARHADRR